MNEIPTLKLEEYLSAQAGEPVIVEHPKPVIVGVYNMDWTGVISKAVVYRCADGKTRATFIPFGA